MILNVPYLSQQPAARHTDCGACCVAMILNAIAQDASAGEVVAASGASGQLSPSALVRGARAFGLNMRQGSGFSLNDLKYLLDDGQPPIALVRYGHWHDRPNRKYTGGHYVLVVGYDDATGQVFINDPHSPPTLPGNGRQRAYSYQIFMDAWSNLGRTLIAPCLAQPSSIELPLSFEPAAGLGDMWVIAPVGLLLRSQSSVPPGSGAVGVTFGQRLTALSPESAPDDKGRTWQQVMTEQGVKGWAPASAGGERYLATTQPLQPYAIQVLDTPPARNAGGLSLRDLRDTNAALLERIPIGEQLTVYNRVTEADGTPWLWVKSDGGNYGWVRERADGVTLIGPPGRPIDGVGPTPAVEGWLIAQPDIRQAPLAPAVPLNPPTGTSQDAVTAARIWNQYGGLLGLLAARLGIDAGVSVAVVAAESGGRGFADGRMLIRFENHVFWSNWGVNHPDAFNAHFQFDPNQVWQGHHYRADPAQPWQSFHGNQAEEWRAFDVARRLDERAARLSISMGLPQIMGFNHAAIGYDSVEAMFDAFNTDERAQLVGFFDFIRGTRAVSRKITALQAQDFVTFALLYNGAGQETTYGATIQRFYNGFRSLA